VTSSDTTRPVVGDCLLFSATTGAEFARYRLDNDRPARSPGTGS
jgi:hypothetical protein